MTTFTTSAFRAAVLCAAPLTFVNFSATAEVRPLARGVVLSELRPMSVQRAADLGGSATQEKGHAIDTIEPDVQSGKAVDFLASTLAELDRIEHYPAGWDGGGAEAPPKSAVALARLIAGAVASGGVTPVRAYAEDGQVGLIWSSGLGYADLSLDKDGLASFFVKGSDGQDEFYSPAAVYYADIPAKFWTLLSSMA